MCGLLTVLNKPHWFHCVTPAAGKQVPETRKKIEVHGRIEYCAAAWHVPQLVSN